MLHEIINKFLANTLTYSLWLRLINMVLTLLIIIVCAVVGYYVARFLIARIVLFIKRKSSSLFLQVIAKNKTFELLAHLILAGLVLLGNHIALDYNALYWKAGASLLFKISLFYIFISLTFIISRLIWSLNDYYESKFSLALQYPIYSYLRVFILLIWLISVVLIISFFMGISPLAILTGLGAVSAVLLLIFKDTLLGIMSSIQVTAQDILRIGDRVILNKYDVDGIVSDISINTIKVRNSDNTIANIPTYMFTSEIIKNWRKVEESNARLIKRGLFIDIHSIIVCDDTMLKKIMALYPVISIELEAYKNSGLFVGHSLIHRYVNLSLYRLYLHSVLSKHPLINHDYLALVRHADITSNGLLLEIYAYTTQVDMVSYEKVQADIFEHAISILPDFSLKSIKTNTVLQ